MTWYYNYNDNNNNNNHNNNNCVSVILTSVIYETKV